MLTASRVTPRKLLNMITDCGIYEGRRRQPTSILRSSPMSTRENYNITVATSDGLQQVIIRGEGCALMSASELREKVKMTNEGIINAFREKQAVDRNYLGDAISDEAKRRMQKLVD